jgi:uncharacterized protein (TIGR02001 family)
VDSGRRAAHRLAITALRLGLGLALGQPGPASAQLGASVAIDSDYRVRGLSVTDLRPAVSLSLSYDHPSGVYAGASLVGQAGGPGARLIGRSEYIGFSAPLGPGRSWDVGVNNQDYELYFDHKFDLRYSEAYVGLVQGDLSAHLYFAPNYPRSGVNSAYAEVTGVHRIAEVWRLTGHLGAHERLGGSAARDGRRWRYDSQVGVVREFPRAEVGLAWVASAPDPLPHPRQNRSGLTLGAKYFF